MPAAGYEISYLAVQGIDRRNPLRAMGAVARAGAAVGAARGLLGRVGADAVLGGGGYVAGPVGLAAVARRTPLRAVGGRQSPGPREPAAGALCAPGVPRVPHPRAGGRALRGHRPPDTARDRRGRPRHGPRAAGGAARRIVRGGVRRQSRSPQPEHGGRRRAPRHGCLRRAHHRPPGLRRGAGARGRRAAELPGPRIPRLACRPARGRRSGRGPRGWLDLRGRSGRTARDPRPLPGRHSRSPDRQRALDGGCRRGRDPARLGADRGEPAGRGRGAARRPAAPGADVGFLQVAGEARCRRPDRRRGDGRDRTGPAGGPAGVDRQKPALRGHRGRRHERPRPDRKRSRRGRDRLRPGGNAVLRRAARRRHRTVGRTRRLTRAIPARRSSCRPRYRATCPR